MAKLTEKEKYKIVIVLNALTSIVGVLKLHNVDFLKLTGKEKYHFLYHMNSNPLLTITG